MDNLDVYETQLDEVVLAGGVKARRKYSQGNGNWFDHSFNDSDCLFGSHLPDCHLNSSQSLSNVTTSSAAINNSSITTLPPHLRFDERSINDIAAYSVLFVIAAIGNLTVFITLFRNRHRKSRVNLMIMHLAAADLMVTLINFPIEVGWRITVQWLAGNLACKLLNFLRAFGLYLSSLVLVCISLDRYFAIVHPLKVNDAQRRGKMMLSFAWSIAAVCSIPQSVIFYEASHPQYAHFKQCVTFYFFETPVEERTYNVFCLVVMYFLPLLIIIIVYFRILWEISQKSKDSKESTGSCGGRVRLRRSDMTNIERARTRTLKMTVIIVLAFIICWTPYVVMVLWYMFDKPGAEQVQTSFQDALFIMAVSNSCVNPIVYGTYTINLRKELNRCFGRKTKPPVLTRRSTVMTTQDGRGSKLHLRSSLSVLHQDNIAGSTALRTTVTAQLSSSNTLLMSTHTQVLPRDDSSRNNSRRKNKSGINGDSSLSHSRRSLHPPSPPTLSSYQVSSSPQLNSESLQQHTSTVQPAKPEAVSFSKASGCVMLEIEVDVDGQSLSDVTASTATAPQPPSPPPPPPEGDDVALAKTNECFAIKSSSLSSSLQDMVSTGRLSFFSSNSRKHLHDNVPESAKLTSFTQLKGTPVTQPKFPSGLDDTNEKEPAAVFRRKLSADSGIFFEGQRRKASNQFIRSLGNQSEVQHVTSRHSDIELKCINPFSSIV